MGTTLTGLEIKDTYDSLIKVTDNGPLTGSLKVLTDGLGNNSAISLSTGAASVTGTLAVSSSVTLANGTIGGTDAIAISAINTNTNGTTFALNSAGSVGIMTFLTASTERMRITAAGNVGIGISAPNTTLSVLTSGTQSTISPIVTAQTSTVTYGGLYAVRDGAGDQRGLVLQTYEANVGLIEKVRITSAGNVGIGTDAPIAKLTTRGTDAASIITGLALENFITTNPSSGNGVAVDFRLNNIGNATAIVGKISTVNTFFKSNADMVFSTFTSDTLTEKARILSSGGITFNGDTAAANALDDYEEGTWTIGVSFGGSSVGMTTSISAGTYTKIGRQVTVNGFLVLTSKGSSTGDAKITGLPFTVANTSGNYSTPSLYFNRITFTNQFQGYSDVNSTTITLEETTILGAGSTITNADFANDSNLIVSLAYFV